LPIPPHPPKKVNLNKFFLFEKEQEETQQQGILNKNGGKKRMGSRERWMAWRKLLIRCKLIFCR